MADILDKNGLTLDDYNTILEYVQSSLNEIYAPDGDTINFDSETPDGQFTNILAQISADARQLAAEIYNSFNPDNCAGSVQDQRYALNYLVRGAGTYTIQNIDITVDRTVELEGLDDNANSPTATAYTVSDNSGNQWYLLDSTTLYTGTTTLKFRAQALGLVQPTIGTIQNQVTKELGVTGVNNPTAALTLGRDEESDLDFRIRRNRSVATRGRNNYDTMLGQLLQLEGVIDARVFVNNTNVANTDVTDKVGGIPPRTVWVIIDGNANADDIGNVVYQNSAGMPTIGDESVNVETTSLQTYQVKYDEANGVAFDIKFTIQNTLGITITDEMKTSIREYITNNLKLNLGEPVETSEITNVAAQALLQFGTGLYALDVKVSLHEQSDWQDFIASTSWQNKFVVSDITIN